jgi:O-antigen/teichoic acid export membrane protein
MATGGGVAGVRSAGASAGFTYLIQLGQTVVLSRLLDPADFGLFAMTLVVTGFATLLAEMGLANAVIQAREVSAESRSSLYWLNVLTGTAAFAVVCLSSPLVAAAYGESRVAGLLPWVALPLLFGSFGQQFQAFFERELEFGRLAEIEVGSGIVGALVAIGAALAGGGVLALAAGLVANTAVRNGLLMLFGWRRWRPSLRLRREDLGGYVGFAFRHSGQRLANYVSANLDYALIGGFLGARPLGYYTVAYNLANLPSSRVNAVVNRVFFPLLARAQSDPSRVRDAYLRLQEYTATINFPIVAGLAITAPLLIPVFYGEDWIPAVPLLRVLCVVGLSRAVAGTIGPLLLALGRPDLGLRWSLMLVCIQTPGLWLAVRTGSALGVALAFAILSTLYAVLNYPILVRALIGPCLPDYLRTMWPSFWASVVMSVVVLACGALGDGLPRPALLAVEVAAGIATYSALTWLTRKPLVLDIARLAYARPRT